MTVARSALRGILSTASAAAFLLACAPAHHARPEPSEDIASDELALEVENHNWSDVLIYALHDGSRTRFAEVTATRSLTKRIPRTMVGANGTVRFLVHRIGGHDDAMGPVGGPQYATARDDYLSPPVSVRTGYTISLTLEDDLQRSTIGIW